MSALKDTVKALTVGGIAPTEATVKDGSYKVQLPVRACNQKEAKLSEQLQKFFDFITSEDAVTIINNAGAVVAKIKLTAAGNRRRQFLVFGGCRLRQ